MATYAMRLQNWCYVFGVRDFYFWAGLLSARSGYYPESDTEKSYERSAQTHMSLGSANEPFDFRSALQRIRHAPWTSIDYRGFYTALFGPSSPIVMPDSWHRSSPRPRRGEGVRTRGNPVRGQNQIGIPFHL